MHHRSRNRVMLFLLATLLTVGLYAHSQSQPSPTPPPNPAARKPAPPPPGVPTREQINQSVELLQTHTANPQAPPVLLKRDQAPNQGPTMKEVPKDFQEHKEVPLPPTGQQALITGMPWNLGINRPTPGRDGRVLYTFGEAMPVVVCSPLRICVVELEAGEQFAGSPHLGDSVRWDLSVETSGNGDTATPLVVLKPKEIGLDTTLLVTTNRRSYYIRLVSQNELYTPIISFSYPDEERAAVAQQIALQQRQHTLIENTRITETATPIDAMFFDYQIKGDPTLRPVRVMDDGVHTYIQMTPEALHRELPTLAIEGPNGRELVNFRVKGNYYIVDRLFDKAVLLLGAGKHAHKVEISRDAHLPHAATTASNTGGN